jgi:hypothetical protein
MAGCNWTTEMCFVFCWQRYDRSSGAADSNIQDEVKKVMNILYHRLQPQFMPSTSYDGLQIRHIFMATIRVHAENWLTLVVLVFKWITQTANCFMWIVTVCQLSLSVHCHCLSIVTVCQLSLSVNCHCLSIVTVCSLSLSVSCHCLSIVTVCQLSLSVHCHGLSIVTVSQLSLSVNPPTTFVQRIWCKVHSFHGSVSWAAPLDVMLCRWQAVPHITKVSTARWPWNCLPSCTAFLARRRTAQSVWWSVGQWIWNCLQNSPAVHDFLWWRYCGHK